MQLIKFDTAVKIHMQQTNICQYTVNLRQSLINYAVT